MSESLLKKMDLFRWRCNEKNDLVDRFIEKHNKTKNESEITLDHSGQQTVGTPLSIKTEVSTPDGTNELPLTQKCCTQANRIYECCGNKRLGAEENSITIKLEYVDVDELYRLQTNAVLDHEQADLQRNPLELVCQDQEDHSTSKYMSAEVSELLIKSEVSTPDATLNLHLNQNCCTAHEAKWTYECCGNQHDDLFEAEENPIAIKSEYEEVDYEHQLQTTNDDVNREEDKRNSLESISQDQNNHSVIVANNTYADDSAAESIQNFLSPGTRNAHSKSHSKNHKHHCPYCSATYPFLRMLKSHIRTHTGEKPYKCKVCDKAFHSSGILANHSKIHNKGKHHQCPHCSSTFVQSTSLKIHIRIHTGEKPYKCKICDKAFHSSGSLAVHLKLHNKDHQCPNCPSKFARSSDLKLHIRKHTGERPYQCKICDKAFKSKGNLAEHSKIHNKAKQHQCPNCPSKFTRSSDLKTHIRSHTGERPYQCKICGKAFTSSSNLTQHSKIHKKDETH